MVVGIWNVNAHKIPRRLKMKKKNPNKIRALLYLTKEDKLALQKLCKLRTKSTGEYTSMSRMVGICISELIAWQSTRGMNPFEADEVMKSRPVLKDLGVQDGFEMKYDKDGQAQ